MKGPEASCRILESKALKIVSSEQGFSLYEALIAMGIAAIVVLSALQFTSLSVNSHSQTMKSARSQLAMHNLVEALLISTGQDGSLDEGVHQKSVSRTGEENSTDTIKAEWTVKRKSPRSDLMEITAKVFWPDIGENLKSTHIKIFRLEPVEAEQTDNEFFSVAGPAPTSIMGIGYSTSVNPQ